MVITRSMTKRWKWRKENEKRDRIRSYCSAIQLKQWPKVGLSVRLANLPEELRQHILTFLLAFDPKYVEFTFNDPLVVEPSGIVLFNWRLKNNPCGCLWYMDTVINNIVSNVCGQHLSFFNKKHYVQKPPSTFHWRIRRGVGKHSNYWVDKRLAAVEGYDEQIGGNAIWSDDMWFYFEPENRQKFSLTWMKHQKETVDLYAKLKSEHDQVHEQFADYAFIRLRILMIATGKRNNLSTCL